MSFDANETAAGPKLIAHRIANAVISDAKPTPAIDFVLKSAMLGANNRMFNQFRKAFGGLWAGGCVDLFEDSIRFSPNAFNAVIQTGEMSRDIMLSAVTEVNCRFGLFTGIIDILHGGDRFTFRCQGSKAFAEMIKAAALRFTSA